MPFTAEIAVTGICGIVPRDSDPPGAPGAFCVVLPNAWKKEPDPENMKPSSVDGVSLLKRHTPFITFTTRTPHTNNRQDLEGLWYLASSRLFVRPTFAGSTPPAAWGDIDGLASYENVADASLHHLFSIKDAVTTPTANKVAAQLVIETGTLTSPEGNLPWAFDAYLLQTAPRTINLNHRATFTLENLTALDIVETDFSGIAGRSYRFTGGPAYVRLANLCDQNPLQWGDEPAAIRIPDDEDFRWHYELVDSPTDLFAELDPFRCPIPRLTADLGAGNGLNCDPKRFPKVAFQF